MFFPVSQFSGRSFSAAGAQPDWVKKPSSDDAKWRVNSFVANTFIECKTERRVPEHALNDPWSADEHYIGDTGALLSVRLLEQFPTLSDDDHVKACLESECVDVRIGRKVPPTILPASQTESLF